MKRFCTIAAIPWAMASAAAGQTVVEGIGEVPQARVTGWIQADADQDGYLSLPEFRVFVRLMADAGEPTARLIRTFGAYGIAFAEVDVNRDGLASPVEVHAADADYQANN